MYFRTLVKGNAVSVDLHRSMEVLIQVDPGELPEPDPHVIYMAWNLLGRNDQFALDVKWSATGDQVLPDRCGFAERKLYRLLTELPEVSDVELHQFSVILHRTTPTSWLPKRFEEVAGCFRDALDWEPIIEAKYRMVPS